MRSLFAALTARGKSFVAAGAVIGAVGFSLGHRVLLSVGALLVILPLLAALAASRARYRLHCTRQLLPPRVPAGEPAEVSVRLQNISRLPTSLLLAEDTVPYSLGVRPRFVLDRIEQGGTRELRYQVRAGSRGRYAIGPFRLRIADVFGLVELGRSFAARSWLVITPAIIPLPYTAPPGSWLGDGEASTATAAAAGEDDVVPRAYRQGDELRRVHWRSTARHGELMVRREEQHWRNRAAVFLDSRGSAHAGRGPGSSFEFAVSAAASIGLQLARARLDCQLVTDTGAATSPARIEEMMLDALADIQPGRGGTLDAGLAALRTGSGGLVIAVAGRLAAAEARKLAAVRRGDAPCLAILLDVASWAASPQAASPSAAIPEPAIPEPAIPGAAGQPAEPEAPSAATAAAALILTAAGWRVATLRAGQSLATAWQRLNTPGGPAAGVPWSGPSAEVTR